MISEYHDEEGALIQQKHHEVLLSPRTNHHSATSHFLEPEDKEEHEKYHDFHSFFSDEKETFGGPLTEGRNKKSPFYKGAACALGLLILGVVAMASSSHSSTHNINLQSPAAPASFMSNLQPPCQRELQQEKCSGFNVDFKYTGEFPPLASCSGSPNMFEMAYHGGPCPESPAGTSRCRDFNSGPPPPGSPKKVYISVTDATSNDTLFAGTLKSGEVFNVFNKWRTLPDMGKVEIYTNISRAELQWICPVWIQIMSFTRQLAQVKSQVMIRHQTVMCPCCLRNHLLPKSQ